MGAPEESYGRRPSGDSQRERRPGGYGGLSTRDDEYARPSSGDRDRRPGGYGGLQQQDDAPQVTRPTSLERREARRRSGERRQGSRGGNYGPGSQRIEDVLQYIRQNWDFMTQDQCVPIEVALKLMDTSSLGLASQHGQFKATHQDLQQALKTIVNGMRDYNGYTGYELTYCRAPSGL